ncbi:MAG TPA: tetratricopeptide repeat protein [Gemmatimonadales bacterium]|jgi:tetratricopeptide (TPR) repeat protein|nr:tetratricopeptide repeat protein [Gemmatimonadales bacterium]
MTTRATILVLATTLAAVPLAAQQGRVNQRLAAGQPAKYTPPLCPLKAINAKVKKGEETLRKSYDAKTPADKAALLGEARETLVDAITKEAQGTSAAAWYYLARVALLRGDAAEADSGFTKAQELVPSCEIDITQYRQNSWAMLANTAIDFQRKGNVDSALALFRDANLLFRALPHVYSNMGVVFANNQQEDSAAIYFRKALEIAEKDTSLVEDRNAAALNLAIMLQRQKQNKEAIEIFRRYLGWKPNDTDAQRSLAVAYRASGMVDSAEAMEKTMVGQFAKTNLDSLDLQDMMAVGVAAFNAQRYTDAEAVFARAVKRNPYGRDARYNLANTYLAMGRAAHDKADGFRKAKQADSAAAYDAVAAKADLGLIAESQKLLELEPMNEDGLRLLAQGQRGQKQDDALLKTAEKLVALPFTVDVSQFQMGAAAAHLSAEATGRDAQDATGKSLKPAPVTLVVEFTDASGAVIDTKEVTIPALAKDAKHSIQVDAKGAGITGWRYHIKA